MALQHLGCKNQRRTCCSLFSWTPRPGINAQVVGQPLTMIIEALKRDQKGVSLCLIAALSGK